MFLFIFICYVFNLASVVLHHADMCSSVQVFILCNVLCMINVLVF